MYLIHLILFTPTLVSMCFVVHNKSPIRYTFLYRRIRNNIIGIVSICITKEAIIFLIMSEIRIIYRLQRYNIKD